MSSFFSKHKAAFKISVIFLVLSSLYIVFSDYIILHFWRDLLPLEELNRIQSYKGLAYVFIIAIVLFILIQRETNVARSYISKLENQQKILKKVTAEKDEIAKKFYTLFRFNPVPIVFTRLNDGQILEANDSYIELSGYTKKELIHSTTTNASIWKNNHDRNRMLELLKKQNAVYDFETQAVRKNGKIIETLSFLKIVETGGEKSIIAIILDVTERVQAEKQIQEYQESLKKLTTELSISEEKQRKKIAANIHDYLSQLLVVSKLRIDELKQRLKSQDKEDLTVISNYISEALENSRKITYELSPPVLYEMGLVETMHWLTEKISDEHGIETVFHSDFEEIKLAESKLILIYRAIQELVNNAVKHAHPGRLEISFTRKNEDLEILVTDNGKGFVVDGPSDSRSIKGGFGLFAVRERISNLGGNFNIVSKPGMGTEVKISVPLDK